MKKYITAGLAAAMSLFMTMSAFGGTWIQDSGRPENQNGISNWWYQNDDGTYPANGWYWLDGDKNGWAESYRFDENGWMYAATKVDNFQVDGSGAWIIDGVVQKKEVGIPAGQKENTAEENDAGEQTGFDNGERVRNQWISDSHGKQYFNSKGEPVTGWKKISSKQYYFDASGYMVTGYQELEEGEFYFYSDGQLAKKTVHDADEGVYYVVDKEDYYVIDIVYEEDWKEYRKEADRDTAELSAVTDSNKKEETLSGSDLTDDEAHEKILSLKSKYPEGKKWTNDDTFRRGNTIGGGCAGFAFIVQDKLYGKNASFTTYDDLDWDELRVGDHLRVYNNSGGEHSVIVLTVEDDYITLVEGNYNSSIHWGRKMTRDSLEANFIYRETFYE